MFIDLTKKSAAFTLIETLISLAIFSVVSVITVTLLVNGMRSAKKIQAQVLLYSEAQALMDQVARDIERNTIDYETYYARDVLGELGWDTEHYGYYAASFYDPGDGGTEDGPYDGVNTYGTYYKMECSTVTGTYPNDCPNDSAIDSQRDTTTGIHPFTGIDRFSGYSGLDSTYMNAFCETTSSSTDCNDLSYGVQDELILINGAGDSRTVYRLEQLDSSGSDFSLSRVKLVGTDSDNDGIEDVWACDPHYDCSMTTPAGNTVPDADDLTDDEGSSQHDFVALSPSELNVVSFQVILSPYENPYNAYGELDEQIQPQITIVMKVTLSSDYSQGLLGDVPTVFIQRTISTGVYSKVASYE